MKAWWVLGLFLVCIALGSAYYQNPYLQSWTPAKEGRSLGTQGGFKWVLEKREGLGGQIGKGFTRKTAQTYKPYGYSALPSIRQALSHRQYFVVKNEYNQYRRPISYADERMKERLAKALGIRVVYDPAAGKNVLIEKIPTRKLVTLLNDPRSRAETFRDREVDVDAVLDSLGLGSGAFVPRSEDDNIKY